MLKINYPKHSSGWKDRYWLLFKDLDFVKKVNKFLSVVKYNGSALNSEILMTSEFDQLILITNTIEAKLGNRKKKEFKKLFNYSSNQSRIATFFDSEFSGEIRSCYYCNLEYVNSFKDIADYSNVYEFLNNGSLEELKLVNGIGETTALRIMNLRSGSPILTIGQLNFISKKTKLALGKFEFQNTHNHFTLDHVLPQSKYSYLSLSLFNFVPSCYSCNSKFKKAKSFNKISEYSRISPSSESFSIQNDLVFRINWKCQLGKLVSFDEFSLDIIAQGNHLNVETYIDMFKLKGRYAYHKYDVNTMIKKKNQVPDSKIKELSILFGKTEIEIRKLVFGEDLFEENLTHNPKSKLRRDIAKQIGIKGVI